MSAPISQPKSGHPRIAPSNSTYSSMRRRRCGSPARVRLTRSSKAHLLGYGTPDRVRHTRSGMAHPLGYGSPARVGLTCSCMAHQLELSYFRRIEGLFRNERVHYKYSLQKKKICQIREGELSSTGKISSNFENKHYKKFVKGERRDPNPALHAS